MAVISWRNPATTGSLIYSNNNLTIQFTGGLYGGTEATEGKTSGKWFYEIKIDTNLSYGGVGVHTTGSAIDPYCIFGYNTTEYSYANNGSKVNNYNAYTYGSSYTTGDVIGIALDLDNSTLSFFKNGVYQGKAYDLPKNTSFSPAMSMYAGGKVTINFGANNFAYPNAFRSLTEYKSYDGNQNNNALYLIKSYNNYYSIKSDYYDSGNKTFTPLTLSGGLTPNTNDIDIFGFDNIAELNTDITINEETFKPIDKIYNNFSINKYIRK